MRSRWRAARSVRSRASHTAGSGRARRASVTVSHRDAHAHKDKRQHDGPCTAAGGPPPAPRVSRCGAVPAGSRCRAGLHLSGDRSCRGLATDSAVRTGGPGRRVGWRSTPLGVIVNAMAILAFAAAPPDTAVGERSRLVHGISGHRRLRPFVRLADRRAVRRTRPRIRWRAGQHPDLSTVSGHRCRPGAARAVVGQFRHRLSCVGIGGPRPRDGAWHPPFVQSGRAPSKGSTRDADHGLDLDGFRTDGTDPVRPPVQAQVFDRTPVETVRQ